MVLSKCDVCRSGKGVAVRFGEKSVLTLCKKCIGEASYYASIQEMDFMVMYMPKLRLAFLKCTDECKFTNTCYEKITTFIWLRSFNDWLIENKRRR